MNSMDMKDVRPNLISVPYIQIDITYHFYPSLLPISGERIINL